MRPKKLWYSNLAWEIYANWLLEFLHNCARLLIDKHYSFIRHILQLQLTSDSGENKHRKINWQATPGDVPLAVVQQIKKHPFFHNTSQAPFWSLLMKMCQTPHILKISANPFSTVKLRSPSSWRHLSSHSSGPPPHVSKLPRQSTLSLWSLK